MGFKKLILIYSLVILVILSLVLLFSYGYYVGGSTETFTAETTDEGVDTLFAQSKYINTSSLVPISSSSVAEKSEKSNFSITYGEELEGRSVGVQIRLVDITIDNNLKDSSFKWQILEEGTVIQSGNFASLSSTTLNLTSVRNVTLSSYPTTKNYELRLYLEEICSDLFDVTTCSDYSAWQSAYNAGTEVYPYNSSSSTIYGQNRMMNKSFSATIEVYHLIK